MSNKFLTVNGQLVFINGSGGVSVADGYDNEPIKLKNDYGALLQVSDGLIGEQWARSANLTSPFYALSSSPDISTNKTISKSNKLFGAITCVYKDGQSKKIAGYTHDTISISADGYIMWIYSEAPDFLWIYNSTVYDALMAQFAQMGFTIDSSDVTTKAGYFYPEMIGGTTVKMHNAEKVYYRLIDDYKLTDITGLSAWINNSTAEVVNNFVIDNDIVEIKNEAFFKCSNLKHIKIPNSTTSIGDYAFFRCANLRRVIIGSNVTSIGESAFYCCDNLIEISIGYYEGIDQFAQLAFIGDYAFQDCTSLAIIYYLHTGYQWRAITKGTNWNFNTGKYYVECLDEVIPKSASV